VVFVPTQEPDSDSNPKEVDQKLTALLDVVGQRGRWQEKARQRDEKRILVFCWESLAICLSVRYSLICWHHALLLSTLSWENCKGSDRWNLWKISSGGGGGKEELSSDKTGRKYFRYVIKIFRSFGWTTRERRVFIQRSRAEEFDEKGHMAWVWMNKRSSKSWEREEEEGGEEKKEGEEGEEREEREEESIKDCCWIEFLKRVRIRWRSEIGRPWEPEGWESEREPEGWEAAGGEWKVEADDVMGGGNEATDVAVTVDVGREEGSK
jgi:hypothetical protein